MTAAGVAAARTAATDRGGATARRGDEYGHLAPLLAEFVATGPDDPRRRVLRDELAVGYWPVVVNIARRYRDRGEPLADLEQVGAVGLMGALQRFDPDRGYDFLSFAVPTITGEIRRHFRDRSWVMRVPRPLKDLQGPIREAVDALTGASGRAPRPSEIAGYLGTTVEQVVEALAARQAYAPDSLDVPTAAGHAQADQLGETDDALAVAECRDELRRGIAELPERERTIVVLRFFDDLTQTQIAARVGLSQMHVSRLLSRTLVTLRGRLDAV